MVWHSSTINWWFGSVLWSIKRAMKQIINMGVLIGPSCHCKLPLGPCPTLHPFSCQKRVCQGEVAETLRDFRPLAVQKHPNTFGRPCTCVESCAIVLTSKAGNGDLTPDTPALALELEKHVETKACNALLLRNRGWIVFLLDLLVIRLRFSGVACCSFCALFVLGPSQEQAALRLYLGCNLDMQDLNQQPFTYWEFEEGWQPDHV